MVRLFELPERLKKKVFNQLTCTQLFDISCCSTKAKETVKEYVPVLSPQMLGIFFDEKFSVSTHGSSFFFTTSRHLVTEENLKHAPRTVITGGKRVIIEFAHSGAGHLSCIVDEHRERTLMHVVTYLLELFKTNCDYLRVTPMYIDDMEPILNATVFKKLKTFELKIGSVTRAEMARFLSRIHAHKWIVTANTGVEYEFSGRFRALDSLKTEIWLMSPESTALLGTPVIILRDPMNFDNRWMNRFIRKWKHSSLDILTRLEVHFTCERSERATLSLEEMMRGCTPFRGRTKKQLPDVVYGVQQYDFENGLDVRKRGGKWASLLMFNRQFFHVYISRDVKTIMCFLVWNEPEPHA